MNISAISKLAKEIKATQTSFSTKVTNVSVYYYPDKDVDFSSKQDLLVRWSADIDMRDWGIKDIMTNINEIVGSIIGETYTEADERKDVIIDIQSLKDFKIIDEDFKFNGTLAPSEIEIDFKSKTIEVK